MSDITKQNVLEEIEKLAKENNLSFDELKEAYAKGAPEKVVETPAPVAVPATRPKEHEGRVTHLTNALYIAGGALFAIALAFTVVQNWTSLDAGSRILVTLGLGMALSVGGWLMLRKTPDRINKEVLGNTFLSIGNFAVILGVFVAANEAGYELDAQFATIMFVLISAVFVALYFFVMRSITWLFFGIASLSFAVYTAAGWYLENIPFRLWPDNFYNYLSIGMGLVYLGLSRVFKPRAVATDLHGAMFVFGHLFVLVPFLVIAFQDSLMQGELGDLAYPVVVAAMIALGAYWRMSRGMFIPVVFLSIYIFHICYEYFADELGGSVALLIAGALVIGLTYVTATLAKRYLPSKS